MMKFKFIFRFVEWVCYLVILLVVSLLLFGARLAYTDQIVIYAQKDKPDLIQVFFQIDGIYSEKDSKRSSLFDNAKKGVAISLPLTSIDRIRIDPTNEAGVVVIKKIEFRHFFGTETYMPSDLFTHIKPIQMIDKLELTPAGLLIHSNGNDPAFELQLNQPSSSPNFIILGIISIILSFVICLFVIQFARCKITAESKISYLFLIPFFMSLGIAALFYPGFMSYDTLHALRSARNDVTDSMWPPMVSYVWRAVDLVSLNPSAMHFSQVFVLLSSIFFIVLFFTKKFRYATLFLLVYLCIPVVLGTVAVIWKDVLMAAFFLASFAVIVAMRLVTNRWQFIILSFIAAFLIFLGVCSRHNAITGALPLIFYWAWVVCSRALTRPLYLRFGIILFGLVLTSTIFSAKTILDNYSLPGFKKLSNSTNDFIRPVRVLDVAGASLCVGRNLFADMAPNLSLVEISNKYDPRHVNLSSDLLHTVGVDSRIDEIWLAVAVHHPICIFNNKLQLTKYMIGANKGDQFLITAPAIDKNEYGYTLPDSVVRDTAVDYVVNFSKLPFLKPWFIYIVSIGCFIYMIFVRKLTVAHLTIFLSGIFYFAGLVAFGNAADARLLFYTTTALLVFIFISIFRLKDRRT